MERTVPTTESEEVDLYQRTYYSLLRTTTDVQIRTLEEAHAGMNSLLHPKARTMDHDMAAFFYSILRLPSCMPDVNLVVLGQSERVFERAGFGEVCNWEEVFSVARRRRCYFDGEGVLTCFIASRSDIDDMIPILTAYQIEWNKLHRKLTQVPDSIAIEKIAADYRDMSRLADWLAITPEDLDRLYAIWDEDFGYNLLKIASEPKAMRIRLLSGSLNAYRRATNEWWSKIESESLEIRSHPVYFISSNTHSVLNLLSGFPLGQSEYLVNYLQEPGNSGLLREWEDIQAGITSSSRENFMYYVFKKYTESSQGKHLRDDKLEHERQHGIFRIPSQRTFAVEAQVYELSRLSPEWIDPRLRDDGNIEYLLRSDALLINIDYPLGMAAYNILSKLAEQVQELLGIYVIGKAATLNGVIGDVMISNVVHDEHSQNTYLFNNCFKASDVAPYLMFGTVLDNQKAVTVQGTFLQNAEYMDVFYREGYTDIEMEAGPYLSAVYELFRPNRHPMNEIVTLYGVPFDLGIVHYASDTPLSKGKNLGAGSLSYFGMDPTYAVTIATLKRIFELEMKRLS